MLSWDRASLGSGTAGAWDSSLRQQGQGCSRDAGILEILYQRFGFCGRVAQVGEIRKEPPKGQGDKTHQLPQKSAAGDSSPEQLLGAERDPIQHGKRDSLLCWDMNAGGKVLYHEC